MAKVTVTLNFPKHTVEQLQQKVAWWDELVSGAGNGIAPEKVSAQDVFAAWYLDDLEFEGSTIEHEEMTE